MDVSVMFSPLYDDIKIIDKIFSPTQIDVLFYTLENSNDYLKTIWGEWMKARDLTILAALRYLILRPKEACCLKFEDFDFRTKTLHIRGENNKERKDRLISIPDKFVLYYKSFLKFPSWMWKGSEYLFPSAENKHISPGRWKHIFRNKILKPAGLWEIPRNGHRTRTCSYLLRKTGATEMLDNGADPWTVAQTLGHADLRTVKNYFFQTERFRERQRDALNTLD